MIKLVFFIISSVLFAYAQYPSGEKIYVDDVIVRANGEILIHAINAAGKEVKTDLFHLVQISDRTIGDRPHASQGFVNIALDLTPEGS